MNVWKDFSRRHILYNSAVMVYQILQIFAGNNAHDNEAKVNNLPEAVMTSGIQLIPLSWNDWITLRFDVIGC